MDVVVDAVDAVVDVVTDADPVSVEMGAEISATSDAVAGAATAPKAEVSPRTSGDNADGIAMDDGERALGESALRGDRRTDDEDGLDRLDTLVTLRVIAFMRSVFRAASDISKLCRDTHSF